jgi:FkbM family methyltransferase
MKTFVEIGSCYFDTLVHLSDHGWRGVILEPVKKYFDKLEVKPNIHYVNAALDHTDGTRTMYMASDAVVKVDRDYAGMSTLVNKSSRVLTTEVEVQTICFKTLFGMTEVTEIDYLKIDTEGYDGEILKMFPWDSITPKFIKYESKHIDNDEIVEMLQGYGYQCEVDRENTYAIKL